MIGHCGGHVFWERDGQALEEERGQWERKLHFQATNAQTCVTSQMRDDIAGSLGKEIKDRMKESPWEWWIKPLHRARPSKNAIVRKTWASYATLLPGRRDAIKCKPFARFGVPSMSCLRVCGRRACLQFTCIHGYWGGWVARQINTHGFPPSRIFIKTFSLFPVDFNKHTYPLQVHFKLRCFPPSDIF